MPDTIVAPAHIWTPAHSSTLGDEAADFLEQVGMPMDPEQRMVLDGMYAVHGGKWAALEAAVICSRQNLKTYTLEGAAITDLFLIEDNLVVWTAHLYPTAQWSFRHIKQVVEGSYMLSSRVKKISESKGEESIELMSGAHLDFLARSKSGGRGLSGDKVILDEGFALDATVMGSLFPTMSARENPQIRYGSSAGKVTSGVLRAIRNRGRAGGDPSLFYAEWCAPEGGCAHEDCDHMPSREGCALDDRENWRMSNPAMGRRISEDFISGERRALPPEEFARERLGWWEDPIGGDSGISEENWRACADTSSEIIGTASLAVDVSQSRWTALALSGRRADGLLHIEVPLFRSGTDWAAADIKGICDRNGIRAVSLDPSGPAGSLIPALEAAGVEVESLSVREMAQATGLFIDTVNVAGLRHLNDDYLNITVSGAARRRSADAEVWDRAHSAMGGAPLIAATAALWAASQNTGGANVW